MTLRGQPIPDNEDLRTAYREALASVIGQRGTIMAVEPAVPSSTTPDSTYPTLDAPGFMTPDGTFPFFMGPGPKIAVLREAGFDVLLATNPTAILTSTPARIAAAPAQGQGPSSGIYRRFLDWDQDIPRRSNASRPTRCDGSGASYASICTSRRSGSAADARATA